MRRINAAAIFGDILVLAIGLGTHFVVHIVGDMPVAEGVLLAALPLLFIARGRRLLQRRFFALFLLAGLWLMSQVLTDIYRQSATLDWLRGDASIVFLILDMAGMLMLLRGNERRKVMFLAASACSTILMTRFHPTRSALAAPWKFGYSGGVDILVVLGSCFFYARRRFGIVLLLFAAIAGVNLLENDRGNVLDMLMTVALVVPVIPERVGRLRLLPRAGSFARLAVLAFMAIGASWTALTLVRLVTNYGLIGQQAVEKNEAQSRVRGGLLLGGRPEILVSSRAVMDSPILGHGSWARDSKYTDMYFELASENGLTEDNLENFEEENQDQIPAHSHLMGAWVDAGILGAVFWAYIFWLTIRALINSTVLRPALEPMYAWMLWSFLWAILFSPLGGADRIYAAAVITILFDLLPARALAGLSKAWFRRYARTGRLRPAWNRDVRGPSLP